MTGTTRRGAALSVLFLTIAALALRLHGLGFGLPHFTHDDGRALVAQVEALRAGQPDPDGRRLYPHLVPRVVTWWPAPGELSPDAPLSEHLARAGWPFLEARCASVWLSLLILPATYLLARTVLRRPGALFATALVATSLLHVSFSQQERPHGALASFTAWTVVAAVALRRRPSAARYLLCGLLAALAVGSLHSGLAVLPPLLAAHLLRERGERRLSAAWALVPLLLVGCAFLLFYPFHFGGHPGGSGAGGLARQGGESVFDLSGHFVKLEHFDGGGFAAVLGSLVSYDPVLSLLGALGLGAVLVSWRGARAGGPRVRNALVLAAYALPYLLAVGLYGKSPERFGLPLLPFVACLGAFGLARLPAPPPLRAALGVLLVGATTVPAWQLTRVRAAPDTYARTAAWIEENVGRDERAIAVLDPWQDLPLARSPEALAANAGWPWSSPWLLYQEALPRAIAGGRDLRVPAGPRPAELESDPLGVLERLGARWVAVELTPGRGPRSRTQRAVREALVAGAELVHRSSPLRVDDGGSERLFVRQVSWRRPVFLRLLAARCTGPTIEVYDLAGTGPR